MLAQPLRVREKATQLNLLPSASPERIKVMNGDRWLLMGTSGSGKTTAAKMLDVKLSRLFPTARHYIFDSKMDGDFDDYDNIVIGNTAPRKPGKNQRYQVWQAIKLIPDEIERWLWMIRHDAPAILMIDELYSLVYGKSSYSDEFNIIQKTGRSLPIGSIVCTQELSKIPQNAFKQSVHRLGFYLEGRYDKLIRNDMLKAKVDNPNHNYGFFYQHRDKRGEPEYFRDIQTFLRGSRRPQVQQKEY